MRSRALLAALPLMLIPSGAHALGATINPGILISGVFGPASAFGLGGEASFMIWPKKDREIKEQIGFGAFLQAQAYNFDHGRYALGVQAGSFVGGELGWAYREPSATGGSQHGVHVAIFGSLGIIVASLRGTIPIYSRSDDAHPAPGFEIALCLALKVPIPVGDVDIMKNAFGSGRFLRHGDHSLASPVVASGHQCARDGEQLAHGRAWARDAQIEHASIPSFLRLASELEAFGAPPPLVHRSRHAALQELTHARDCFAIASERAGVALSAGGLPAAPARLPDLERIAVEAWIDGCIGERAAALAAREARATSTDMQTDLALGRIARDEASHADLAWDIVAFALARGGEPIARAIRRAALPSAQIDDAETARLDSRGRVSHARSVTLRDLAARRARERLAPMVATYA